MRVVFRVGHYNGFEHVKAEFATTNRKATLDQFVEEIKHRYPNFNVYYWRHRPSREEHREFEGGTTVRFYARFSVRLHGHHANPVGGMYGAAE